MIIRQKTTYPSFNDIILHQPVYRFVLFCALTLVMFVPAARCELKAMNDGELKSITGQAGFTQLALNNNTARFFLDIHVETFGTIGGLSAGNPNGEHGWDIQWNDVKIGHSMNDPLLMDGMVLIADFDDLGEADPKLERLVFGTNRLQGTLSADMNSFPGMYNPELISNNGGEPPGHTTFDFNSNGSQTSDMGFFFVINLAGSTPGFQIVAGYDEKTLNDMSQPWWDSP